MENFKKLWNLEMALEVIQHETVDSDIWSEAIKWLLLYGPPEIQNMLRQASDATTRQCFPNLTSSSYTANGQPCYDLEDLAEALGLTKDETIKILGELEEQQDVQHLFSDEEIQKIH